MKLASAIGDFSDCLQSIESKNRKEEIIQDYMNIKILEEDLQNPRSLLPKYKIEFKVGGLPYFSPSFLKFKLQPVLCVIIANTPKFCKILHCFTISFTLLFETRVSHDGLIV